MNPFPIKYIFNRDNFESRALVGTANRGMAILENLMSFQSLDQYSIQFIPYPGALIKCSKSFGIRTIQIFVGGGGGEERFVDKYECLCFPHFSFGIIMAVYPSPPLETDYEGDPDGYAAALDAYNLWVVGQADRGRFTYDVLVCIGNRSYVLVEDVRAAGWDVYYVGQFVLVSIGQGMSSESEYPEYDCDRDCLMQEPQFPILTISALHIPGEMHKWKRWRERVV